MLILIVGMLLVFAAGLTTVLYFVYLLDSALGGYDFATSGAAARKIGFIIAGQDKPKGEFYDLGSSRGGLIFNLLGQCPQLTATGVDNSRLRTYFSRVIALFRGQNAKFLTGDIFAADVSQADIVYMYLDISLMPRLEQKLRKELKSGAMAITNTQFFPSWAPSQTYIVHPGKPEYEKLFVYVN